jgi:hypothetical protein
VTYYCRRTAAGLMTELVHYHHLGLPDIHDIVPAEARTA